MPRIIRAGLNKAAQFNFEDVASQATACVAQARLEAAQILTQAAEEAEAVRAQAETAGRAAAAEAIDRMVEERVAARFAQLEGALASIKNEAQAARQDWVASWQEQGLKLSLAIARRVIRRELAAQPEIPVTLAQEALQLATGATRMKLLMNPADVRGLADRIQQVLSADASGVPVQLVSDKSIEPGGCRVETEFGAIDQQFTAQLARISEELT
ncbi:MAG TPA: FliH/SctL family protein [Pirellulales bacterium]|nr:FliH/SctL family protein [Pirellulales bacterium]